MNNLKYDCVYLQVCYSTTVRNCIRNYFFVSQFVDFPKNLKISFIPVQLRMVTVQIVTLQIVKSSYFKVTLKQISKFTNIFVFIWK